MLSAARQHSPTAHALVAMLGMLGLRVSEACHAQIEELHYSGGYEVLRVVGRGAKPAEIALPIPVLRAVKAGTDGRARGPDDARRSSPELLSEIPHSGHLPR
jgi:integrase/recombinase XerD